MITKYILNLANEILPLYLNPNLLMNRRILLVNLYTVTSRKQACIHLMFYIANFIYKFSDVTRSFKRIIQSSVSCNLGKTCNECKTPATCQQINICKCQEKRIRESSAAPCDCSDTPSNKTHQSTSGMLSLRSEDSDSDEEFCECCTCGCEATENSSI